MELVYSNVMVKVFKAPADKGRAAKKPYLLTDSSDEPVRLCRATTEEAAIRKADKLLADTAAAVVGGRADA